MKIKQVDIGKVVPYERNPRRNEKAIDLVAASIQEYGWRQPIVVDPEMVVIAGHTRLEAARKLGLAKVPIHVAEDLTAEQIKAYRIADNRTAEQAEWDPELLKLEIDDLQLEGYDLQLTGFSEEEVGKLLKAAVTVIPPGSPPEEKPPAELSAGPESVEGDFYDIGMHRIVCGDANFASAYALLFDDEAKASLLFAAIKPARKSEGITESLTQAMDVLPFAEGYLKDKGNTFFCIMRGTFSEYLGDLFGYLEKMISAASKPGDIILDVSGNGGLLEACQKSGRVARLIENDPKNCDALVKRMRKQWPDLVVRRNGMVMEEIENGNGSN